MIKSSLPFCCNPIFSASSGIGSGIDSGVTTAYIFFASTSGNGTVVLESKDLRGPLLLFVFSGVRGVSGGVIGRFVRFAILAPRR